MLVELLDGVDEEIDEIYIEHMENELGVIVRVMKQINGVCIAWNKDKGCLIYDMRPAECRDFNYLDSRCICYNF